MKNAKSTILTPVPLLFENKWKLFEWKPGSIKNSWDLKTTLKNIHKINKIYFLFFITFMQF